ncbi:MAG: tannase/feruloyl esterase family alpha/beta hydrolase [Bryobacteraceae bacterium]
MIAGIAGLGLALAAGAMAQPANLAVVTPVAECPALAGANLSSAAGAPVYLTSAAMVQAARSAPYCRVLGYVEPSVWFEVRLPSSRWTHRFVQTGCGGLCGTVGIQLDHSEDCAPSQNGELALASTDMGHSGGGTDASWGAADYRLRIDFAYRGVHVTALVAKALIERYYGQGPKYSYFLGCSDGGREALMEAQRYPEDFDGIAAGAPAMNFITQNTFYHGWNAHVNTGSDGKPILTADKLPALHRAALDACDAADGLKDGLIGNPADCRVDLSAIACRPGTDASTCLTTEQARVAREIYAGAHDAQGNKLTISGPMAGSEPGWAGVLLPNRGQDGYMGVGISTGTLKYLVYAQNPPGGFTLRDFRFDRASFDAATKLHSLYDATDPDLRPFAAKGGKLILWHGWADPHISPLNTVAYYAAMQRVMGADAVSKFSRLYLFPGGFHCGGGEGPFDFDALTPLMAWTERGSAPEALTASHRAAWMRESRAGKPDRTRPVFPYPLTAKYKGIGSIDDAANFSVGAPRPVDPERLEWLGSGFYTARYESWCTAKGTAMTCQESRQGK